MIYEYHSDKKTTYNSLKIELQIRSLLQHIWATAVETVGTFTSQTLKASQGEKDWLRFFSLIEQLPSSIKEKRPTVPNTPSSVDDLLKELKFYAERLEVHSSVKRIRSGLKGN